MDGKVKNFIMSQDIKLTEKFKDNLRVNVNLSNFSWFNLGGNAEYFFKAEDKQQLLELLKETKKKNLETSILGAGSNTLFRDNGVKGVVIKLGKNFSYTKILSPNILAVGAATLDRTVANFAKKNNLGNLEFLSCIPGSIGGAIVMNSGCYGQDISKILISIKVIDKKNLSEFEILKKDIKFFYRGTNLSEDFLIIAAKLQCSVSETELIEKKQLDFLERKKKAQPNQIKTCGSTFKNINENKKAWKLIKESGCSTLSVGGASISPKHCNFFVNNGNAKASDIENLIKKVKKKVYEKTGVSLELEIKIVGE